MVNGSTRSTPRATACANSPSSRTRRRQRRTTRRSPSWTSSNGEARSGAEAERLTGLFACAERQPSAELLPFAVHPLRAVPLEVVAARASGQPDLLQRGLG